MFAFFIELVVFFLSDKAEIVVAIPTVNAPIALINTIMLLMYMSYISMNKLNMQRQIR